MSNQNDDIIRLLKHGRSEEVRMYVNAQKKEKYPEDFTVFMQQMLAEYHVKKKEVAIRSGLSQDYTYKLLNGAKRTKERDYILAMCIAIGMNISQTQHALNIYGMPLLNRADLRSSVIYHGIEDHQNIDTINEWMRKADFPYIKTSPDMPSASIELRMNSEETNAISTVKINHSYEEIDREIEAEHCGNAPMDYSYWGIITVRDESGRKYYVEAAYAMEGDNLIVLDEENYQKSIESIQRECETDREFFAKYPEAQADSKWFEHYPELVDEYIELHSNNVSEPEVLEQYESLLEASGSEFFKFFLELDHATDEKVIETMNHIDDTRNYGLRIGAGFRGGHKLCYLEAYNTNNPAEREYLQVVQKDGEMTYSASHESYFMRLELGEIYSAYFGEKREPEYYISVKDTKELTGIDLGLKFTFDDLRLTLLQYAKDTFGGLFDTEDEVITQEMISSLIQRATMLMHGDNPKEEEALECLLESISMMEEAEKRGEDYLITLMITYSKAAIVYGNLGDIENLFETYEKLYAMKDRALEILDSDFAGVEDALWSLAEAMIHKAQKCQNLRGQYDPEAKAVIKEAIDLLEGRCTHERSYAALFMAYTKYAYIVDVDEPELAARCSRKAIKIVNAYHLDQNPQYQGEIVTLYNNYAWVLWNKLGSEEAVIYYGRAIELLESFIFTKSKDREYINANLAHEGEALYNLYVATNKEREARTLKERLEEDGVVI